MDLLGDFGRGLGLIGSAIGGNTQPLQGAVANTLGVQPGVWDQALQQSQRPMYQRMGYQTPAGPLATPVDALTGAANRVSQALRR